MGSFDFVSPNNSKRGHNRSDVEPWIKFGNSPEDTKTRAQRDNSTGRAIFGPHAGYSGSWLDYFHFWGD